MQQTGLAQSKFSEWHSVNTNILGSKSEKFNNHD